MNGYLCVWLTAYACAWGSSGDPSGLEAAVKEPFRAAADQYTSSLKSVFVSFWDRDFRNYELHGMIQRLIDQIDNEEMLKFLQDRGVPLTPEKILTSDNLIAYWQYKKLGTPAVYAWLDLLKGNPNFVKAVLDWNAIRKERGFEFIPTYHLLFHARLETKKDGEVWADLFKATFATLTEHDRDKKMLMLFCSFARILGNLKEVDPPLVERFAFLGEELKKQQDPSKPYPQALLFALFEIHFGAKRFNEAAGYAARLLPPMTGLRLSLVAQALAKDLDVAASTFSKIEKVAPEDTKTLDGCRQILRQLKEMKQKQESAKPSEAKP